MSSRSRTSYFSVGVGPVARKEFADHLSGLRFGVLLVLIGVASVAAVYSAGSAMREVASEITRLQFGFLKLFTVSGESLPSLVSFISFLAPLLGIALGFDAINAERSQGTLSRLISQPIHRDAVLQGKFVAGLGIVTLALTAIVLIVGGVGLALLGVPPAAEEIWRLIVWILVTALYVGFWLAVAQLFSVVFKQAATSALASIAVWLFFTIFFGLLLGLFVNAVAPAGSGATDLQVLRHEQLSDQLSRLSPVTLYSEATAALLDPTVRSLGVLVGSQVDRALVAPLGFGQSLLLVWPQIVSLLAACIVFFAVSYIVFMREEIRA